MRPNLFYFATKELSQDAFLSWFIASCNDEEIGKYSYDFINTLTGFNIKYGDIKDQPFILQQEHGMDIVVDLYTKNNLHYVIVIEDKTDSSAHSHQLKRYSEIIEKWNLKEDGHENRTCKIFYKTNELSEQDRRELTEGNVNNRPWLEFDIEKIHNFFKNIPQTSSEILNSYVQYVNEIYDDITKVSSEPISEWNYVNYRTFLKKEIFDEYSKNNKNTHFETTGYQGRSSGLAFYYHPSNDKLNVNIPGNYKCFAYPLVEFLFRKGSPQMIIYTHITYHWYDESEIEEENRDKWDWKASHYKPDSSEANKFMQHVQSCLKRIEGIKVHAMNSEKNQTISTESVDIPNNIESFKTLILKKLKIYFQVFMEADRTY